MHCGDYSYPLLLIIVLSGHEGHSVKSQPALSHNNYKYAFLESIIVWTNQDSLTNASSTNLEVTGYFTYCCKLSVSETFVPRDQCAENHTIQIDNYLTIIHRISDFYVCLLPHKICALQGIGSRRYVPIEGLGVQVIRGVLFA